MQTRGRSGARRLVMQALYQVQISGHDLDELRGQFRSGTDYQGCDNEYFESLLQEVCDQRASLDQDIADCGDIAAEQLDPVERAVLWLALAEIRFHDDVPLPVIINEAVELAKVFGAEGGHRYVNGLLDKAGEKLRAAA